MAGTTTLLSYELTLQMKFLELATNSQQANDYVMACFYAERYASVCHLKDKIPKPQIPEKTTMEAQIRVLQNHFMNLIALGVEEVVGIIDGVRKDPKYNKGGIVPQMTKEKK